MFMHHMYIVKSQEKTRFVKLYIKTKISLKKYGEITKHNTV